MAKVLPYFTVGGLADELGVSPSLIRWYEQRGIVASRRLRVGRADAARDLRVFDEAALRAARAWRAKRAGRGVVARTSNAARVAV